METAFGTPRPLDLGRALIEVVVGTSADTVRGTKRRCECGGSGWNVFVPMSATRVVRELGHEIAFPRKVNGLLVEIVDNRARHWAKIVARNTIAVGPCLCAEPVNAYSVTAPPKTFLINDDLIKEAFNRAMDKQVAHRG